MEFRTLVLRKDYTPISLFPLGTIPSEDAITRVIAGTCEIVSSYNIPIRTQNPKHNFKWPSIIRRLRSGEKIGDYNSIPPLKDEFLYYRDHCICVYCGVVLSLRDSTLDHIVPISKGGKTEWKNSGLACTRCNSLKGNNLPTGKWTPNIAIREPTLKDLINARKKFPITVNLSLIHI